MNTRHLTIAILFFSLCTTVAACGGSDEGSVPQNSETQALQQQTGDKTVGEICGSLKSSQPGAKTLSKLLGNVITVYDEDGANPSNQSYAEAICSDTGNYKSNIDVGLWDCSERSTQCLGFCNKWCSENGGGGCKTAYCGAIWCTAICLY